MALPMVTDLGFSTKKKRPPAPGWTAADVEASLQANPDATFGPSPGVNYSAAPVGLKPPSLHVAGYDPDYSALIAGDPLVVAGAGDLGAYQGQLNDARRAAIRRAVISAGLAPGSALGDVDEQTIKAANENQFSGLAELSRSRGRSESDLGAALGARGLTFSGGQEAGGQRIQEGYERGTSQLTQQLLDAISGFESDFAGKLSQVKSQYAQLREQAALRVQADPRYQPIGETDAVLDPTSGLYMTPDGRWYDQTGKRVTPPVPVLPGATTPPTQVAPPVLPPGGLVANPQLTPEEYAAIARQQPGFYESDNLMAAAGAGRGFF